MAHLKLASADLFHGAHLQRPCHMADLRGHALVAACSKRNMDVDVADMVHLQGVGRSTVHLLNQFTLRQ